MSNTAVFGIYPTRARVEVAVTQLQKDGFRPEDISILMAHNEGTKDLAVEKSTKAPEGAATGAASGALWAARSPGWRRLESSRFQGWDRSSRPGR